MQETKQQNNNIQVTCVFSDEDTADLSEILEQSFYIFMKNELEHTNS